MGLLAQLGPVILIAGIALIIMAARTNRRILKDEFERRTSGGTLEYDNYDEAERAQGKKARNKLLGNLGIGLALLGLLVTIASPALLGAQRSDDAYRARQNAAGYCLAGDSKACEVQAAYGRCVQGDRRACDDAAALERRWEQSRG